jgi:hypothetical protein
MEGNKIHLKSGLPTLPIDKFIILQVLVKMSISTTSTQLQFITLLAVGECPNMNQS